MPAVLLASIAVVWLTTPTTLCGRFEGLDHLISELAFISTAFGTNIFTSARATLDLAVSVIYTWINLLCNLRNLAFIYINQDIPDLLM